MTSHEYLGKILGVEPDALARLDQAMTARVGKSDVLEKIVAENREKIARLGAILGVHEGDPDAVRTALRNAVLIHEGQLAAFTKNLPGENEFKKAAAFAKRASGVRPGFFLKREYAESILRARPPEHVLAFFGYRTVDELLAQHDVLEAFSALRFMESDQWMHETFDAAYGAFTPNDFEERDIEVKVLGPEWQEVAKKFVAKKHHNVSHLKEFGVIFINPISEDVAGKFLRDAALLLHYVHEIEFYSKLFKRHSGEARFAENLKALLRGDVKEVTSVGDGEWLIVQRYLFKENPSDPRLLLPRVNPESMHWLRGERDLALFEGGAELNLKLWNDLDWVGDVFSGEKSVTSFDMEDNAMSVVSANEGKPEFLNYHQREALWTKIFKEYAGGEEEMERLLIENFHNGVVVF